MHYMSVVIKLFEDDCDLPEEGNAPHSSTLAWEIPWTEEAGKIQSTGSLRVGHN